MSALVDHLSAALPLAREEDAQLLNLADRNAELAAANDTLEGQVADLETRVAELEAGTVPLVPRVVSWTNGPFGVSERRIDFTVDAPVLKWGHKTWTYDPDVLGLVDPARRAFDLTYLPDGQDQQVHVWFVDGTEVQQWIPAGSNLPTVPAPLPTPPTVPTAGGVANVRLAFGVHGPSMGSDAMASVAGVERDLGLIGAWVQGNGPGAGTLFGNLRNWANPGNVTGRNLIVSIPYPGVSYWGGPPEPAADVAAIVELVAAMKANGTSRYIVNIANEWDMVPALVELARSGQMARDLAAFKAKVDAERFRQGAAGSWSLGAACIGRPWSIVKDDVELAALVAGFVTVGSCNVAGTTVYDGLSWPAQKADGSWVDEQAVYDGSTAKTFAFWRTVLTSGALKGKNVGFFCPEWAPWGGPGYNWDGSRYSSQQGGNSNPTFNRRSVEDLALFPATGDGHLEAWSVFCEQADVPHDPRVWPAGWAAFKKALGL